MFAQPLIDSIDFARNSKQLRGELAINELARLNDLLADNQGSVAYELLGYSKDDSDFLRVNLEGVCHLRCQRCLGVIEHRFNLSSKLKLLTVAQLAELDEVDDDGVEEIEASSELDLMALVEDELLLGLPFAPKHNAGECDVVEAQNKHSTNPFAILAGLKK
ncbi:MAG: YceD family protein [Sideroxydans sp.]|nr:YceD family protein [Sideroxydans sp.]